MPMDRPDGGAPRAPRVQHPLGSARRRLLVAAVALTGLVVGYLVRPEEPVAARLQEAPAPLLQEAVEQRAPQTVFRTLQRAGAGSLMFVARIEVRPRPLEFWSDLASAPDERPPDERYGVVVGPDEILAEGTGVEVADAVAVTIGDGRQMSGTVTAHFPDRALALVTVDTSIPLAVPPAAAAPSPGDAVVAVGPGAEGHVVAPLFVAGVTRSGIRAASPLDGFRGMGVFAESGALLGIIARAGEEPRILPLAVALAPVPFRPPPAPLLGVSLARVPDPTGKAGHVIEIADVAPDAAAARLGLRPGDLLLGNDAQPPATVEAARTLLQESDVPGGQVRVLRGGRPFTLRRPSTPADTAR